MPSTQSTAFDATVVIVTYNRKEELRNAVASSLQQEGNVEVIVLDDGSTDGTEAMMAEEFPHVQYDRGTSNVGYIAHRNRASDLANSPILISIDDDAAFPSSQTVRQTLADFDHPRIGAVAIPYVDVLKQDTVLQRSPNDTTRWVAGAFRGTAYAVRKEVFDETGRFRELFRHMNEESDFYLRMLDAGFVVRLGNADPIHHFESPKRVKAFNLEQASRNWVIMAMLNYPLSVLPYYLAGTCFNTLRTGLREGMPLAPIKGLLRGFGYAVTHLGQRKPVDRRTFRLYRRLKAGEEMTVKAVVEEMASDTK